MKVVLIACCQRKASGGFQEFMVSESLNSVLSSSSYDKLMNACRKLTRILQPSSCTLNLQFVGFFSQLSDLMPDLLIFYEIYHIVMWLGEVDPPVDYGRLERVFVKRRLKNDNICHSY